MLEMMTVCTEHTKNNDTGQQHERLGLHYSHLGSTKHAMESSFYTVRTQQHLEEGSQTSVAVSPCPPPPLGLHLRITIWFDYQVLTGAVSILTHT